MDGEMVWYFSRFATLQRLLYIMTGKFNYCFRRKDFTVCEAFVELLFGIQEKERCNFLLQRVYMNEIWEIFSYLLIQLSSFVGKLWTQNTTIYELAYLTGFSLVCIVIN